MKFEGTYTAIITPFRDDETIDEATFAQLIEFNLAGGVEGIVPCGTTGESPTLSTDEHNRLIEFTVECVRGRGRVIAGTGSNSTREAIGLTQHAEQAGADAALLVSPYYNKPTQEGLYRHFKAIAANTGLPCILYNIKGRTAVNIETPTLLRLAADCRNIVAVKEASGDMDQIRAVLRERPAGFGVLSGDDGITLEVLRLGGQGIISVVANIVPEAMSQLTRRGLAKDFAGAEAIHNRLTPLFKTAFIETNPIPIKAMLALLGMCREVYRLPLCELRPESRAAVEQTVRELSLVEAR